MTVELLTIGFIRHRCCTLIARVPHHLLAIAGATVFILASVGSARVVDFNELYLWRILAGIGCGCLVTTANAAIAQSRAPILLYGLAWAAAYAVTAALAIAITETNETVTANIVYGWLAGALIIFLPLLWLLPKQGAKAAASPFPWETLRTGSRLMLGIMIFGISMMAYYAFLERLATSIGASPAVTGRIIAASQIAGIAGGLIAAQVATTFGLLRSLLSATVLHALVIVFAIWTEQALLLGIAAFCEVCCLSSLSHSCLPWQRKLTVKDGGPLLQGGYLPSAPHSVRYWVASLSKSSVTPQLPGYKYWRLFLAFIFLRGYSEK